MGTDIENIQINKKNILFREVGFKLVQSWLKFSKETKVILVKLLIWDKINK